MCLTFTRATPDTPARETMRQEAGETGRRGDWKRQGDEETGWGDGETESQGDGKIGRQVA